MERSAPPQKPADREAGVAPIEVRAQEELEKLNAFAISLLQQNTLEDLLWSIADNIGRLLGFEDCVIYLLQGETLVQAAASGVKNPRARLIKNPITIPLGKGITGTAAASGLPELIHDTRSDPRYIPDEFSGLSELTVPILFEERVLGVIDSEHPEVGGFTDDDLRMLQAVANIAASRIASALADKERRRAEEELKRARDELEERVRHRTAALSQAIRDLETEVEKRTAAEAQLAREKERLALTMRSIGDGLIATDVEGRVVLMSDSAERLTGWPRRDAIGSVLGRVFSLRAEEDPAAPIDPLAEALVLTGPFPTRPLRCLLVDRRGRERLISAVGSAVSADDGSAIGAVFVFRDITLETRIEEEAQKAQRMQSLGALAGGIAHDFNNMLTAILGYWTTALQAGISDTRRRELLAKVEAVCTNAQGLSQQLLTFSAGGAPITAAGDVGEVIREAADFALRGSKSRCRLALPGDLAHVEMDPRQISQVLHNLLLNADQAMPDGGTVQVAARNAGRSSVGDVELPKGEEWVEITIEDGGVGISRANLDRIFDPFFTTKKGGHGLGLATSHSIVRRHGGCLLADSDPGHGSTFRIYLPASADAPAQPPPPARHPDLVGSGRLLLMDDTEEVRQAVGLMLETMGFDVTEVAHGEAAVDAFAAAIDRGQPFRAVILDLTVPGRMGGRETIRRLRRLDEGVVAIVSSGYSNDPVLASYEDHGFKARLEKPFTFDELKEVLRSALED